MQPGLQNVAPGTIASWESVIEDLVPLSTQLLTPTLAEAFEIPTPRPVGAQATPRVGGSQGKTSAEGTQQRAPGGNRLLPPGGAQQQVFPTYYPATATAPQQQGNAQADGPTQAGAQHMPGLNQQLQGLGVQPQAFNLKADEKSSHQGPSVSVPGQHSVNWLEAAMPATRMHLPQSGGKHAPDANAASDPENGDDIQTRALKRPRLVWTAQLHQRFVDAVKQLGLKNAVPKTIMQLMNVDGLTRENVASHLQKYRLQLRKEEGRTGDEPEKGDDEDIAGEAEVLQG